MTVKQIENKIKQIVNYGQQAGMNNVTLESTKERYQDALNRYGIERTNEMLDHTVKLFKKKAREQENTYIHNIKNELFKTVGSTPTIKKDIIELIKSGELDKYNIIAVNEYKQKYLVS